MLNFWASIVLDIVGCAVGGFIIAKTVRMDQRERMRFFLGPKRIWPLYLGIVVATLGWANALVAFRKGHWGWHAFQMAAMLVVFSYTLFMWAKVRRTLRHEQPTGTETIVHN